MREYSILHSSIWSTTKSQRVFPSSAPSPVWDLNGNAEVRLSVPGSFARLPRVISQSLGRLDHAQCRREDRVWNFKLQATFHTWRHIHSDSPMAKDSFPKNPSNKAFAVQDCQTEDRKVNRLFSDLAHNTSREVGRAWVFASALGTIVVWALSGLLFGFSDTWQLVINTGTTIITFLMVFLIQNSQNRDAAAIQIKLNELIRVSKAHNFFVGIERLTDEEIEEIRCLCESRAREELVRTAVAKNGRAAIIASSSLTNWRFLGQTCNQLGPKDIGGSPPT